MNHKINTFRVQLVNKMNCFSEDIKRLAIGTAQYGMNYGIANQTGIISDLEMNKILKKAKENKIFTIDTAKSYGDSERKLGTQVMDEFSVMTKVSDLTNFKNSNNKFILDELKDSLQKLNLNKLDTLLLHRSNDLLDYKRGNL